MCNSASVCLNPFAILPFQIMTLNTGNEDLLWSAPSVINPLCLITFAKYHPVSGSASTPGLAALPADDLQSC